MSEVHTVDLGPELTIVHAAAHRETLLNHLAQMDAEGAAVLTLDLSGAAEVDSSAVQWLLALRRSLLAQGRQLQLQSPSRVWRDTLALYGLQEHFDTAPAAA
jgi:anti-anti-sigma regulatory factor